jgi:hypothetical protein
MTKPTKPAGSPAKDHLRKVEVVRASCPLSS